MIKELKKAESVDICFLVDCTGSMGPYIEQVKTIINKTNQKLRVLFKDLKLRSSFIGYRDYDSKGNTTKDQLIVFHFTTESSDFEKFVETVVATGGGDGKQIFSIIE